MKKIIHHGFSLNKRKIAMVANLLFLPILGLSQTKEQVQTIRKKTNLKELSKIEQNFKSNELSVSQLKTLANKKGLVFSGEVNGKQYQLVGFDRWTKEPLYYITYNVGAAQGTLTSNLNSSAGIFELDGVDMIVHEWDGGGVLVDHQEFGGRAFQKDAPFNTSNHSTHVAGTMIASGVDANAKGMAPKATLHAYDWTSDKQEMAQAAQNGALVSNHSYGLIGGFAYGNWSGTQGWHWFGDDEETEFRYYGKYTSLDRDFDMIALNAPYYLPVKAAGNDKGAGPSAGGAHFVKVRNENSNQYQWISSTKERQKNGGPDGFDIINQGSLGKNLLIVGASNKIPVTYTSASDVQMASFSSFGPVDDGRIKPDIAGVGVDVYSTGGGNTSEYVSLSGTSMASPNVTGTLLLLQEHYKKESDNDSFMKAATLKALVISSANEAGPNDGPDYGSGWGLLNAYKAALTISTLDKYSLIKEDKLRNGGQKEYEVVASGNEPLKVTISWVDPVPTNSMMPDPSILNDRLPVLVNDLDLRITKDGETYYPWKLDPANPGAAATKGDNLVDNVEQVIIDNPEKGAIYKITIGHKGSLKKNTYDNDYIGLAPTINQDFSLIATGIDLGVSKDLALTKIEVDVEAKDYSTATPVNFVIENKGEEIATNAKLKYTLYHEQNEVKTEELPLETINSKEKYVAQVNLDLSQPFINYRIEAELVYDGDEILVNNKNQGYGFTNLVDLRPDVASHFFGFEDDMTKNGWIAENVVFGGKTWRRYEDERYAKSGTGFAISFPNSDTGVNDWLYSNPLKVKANTKYRVIFNSRKFQEPEESISVYFGKSPDSEMMTTKLGEEIIPIDGGIERNYHKFAYEFEVDHDGVIYLGFNHKSPTGQTSYALALDDVTIEHADADTKPRVEFVANNTSPSTYDVVKFTTSVISPSDDPATSYKWKFAPNTVEFKNGTSSTSKEPEVVFLEEKNYSVIFSSFNKAGEGRFVRNDYFHVFNVNVDANFEAAKTDIYEGETVTFSNTSTGKPLPSEFEWTITPDDGVEILSQDENGNLIAKFNQMGTYSVKFKATSQLNSDEITKTDLIRVESSHLPVRNLTKSIEDNTGKLKLNWEKPTLLPVYFEEFNSPAHLPADMKVYDINGDGVSWRVSQQEGVGSSPAAISLSWYFASLETNDWLVTPKLRSGAELLKFMVKHSYVARYDVYIVPVPSSGTYPTVDEILENGHKVYTEEAETRKGELTEIDLNISEFTDQEFFVAFHHRTAITDNSLYLIIDNIMVGYESTPYEKGENEKSNLVDIKSNTEVVTDHNWNEKSIIDDKNINFGVINTPSLEGYKIEKNGEEVEYINDVNNTMYTENLSKNGTYTYDVYAVYSDRPSDPVSITIDISSLSVKGNIGSDKTLQVYPNPSNGKFIIENTPSVTSFNVDVVNLAGQKVFQDKFSGNKAELNLINLPKGVYVINILDNNNQHSTVKVIIK